MTIDRTPETGSSDAGATARRARIEVFRPGTFTPMSGPALTFSAEDLRALAEAYDYDTAPAPIVVGHPSTDSPAFGWVRAFEWDEAAQRLYAQLDEIEPVFAEAVAQGRYRKVSLALFLPDQPANPAPGAWYPRHVGFLGGAAPAVPGLRNASFAEDGAGVATFATSLQDMALGEIAALFRALRDWIIEKEGVEAADRLLPAWRLDWLPRAAEDASPAYAATPPAETAPATPTETHDMTDKAQAGDAANPNAGGAEFAAREAAIAAREAELAQREREVRHAENAAFAERLVGEGRLLPAQRARVVALMDALPEEASVSFAAGEAALTPAAALKAILEAQPKAIATGRVDIGASDPVASGATADFAADGRPVDPEQLAVHQRAVEHQRQHGGAYLDAVRAVQIQ